jgi:hypothetical protein
LTGVTVGRDFTTNPTTGAKTIITVFGGKVGKIPNSNIAYHAGSFYGDTRNGGNNNHCKRGCGVSYKIRAATGHETVQETFKEASEAYSGMIVMNGNAYETLGGGSGGYGELLQVDLKSGHQTLL